METLQIEPKLRTRTKEVCEPQRGIACNAPPPRVLRFLACTRKLKAVNHSLMSTGSPAKSAEFMRRAISLALENVRSGGGPFGAVIVRDGRIVAESVNRVTANNDPTAHAEVAVIREACRALGDFQLAGCDLYTTCEPCPMCFGAIYWARLSRVFYGGSAGDAAAAGFDDSFIYEEIKHAPESRRIAMTQLLRDESLAIFSAWKQQDHKTQY
jgi:guanine deaminase